MVNKFKSRHNNDPCIPDISFVRASIIPHLQTELHTTLPEWYQKALRSLITNKDLTVLTADKGGATCVLQTTKYYALGLDILKDSSTFKPVLESDVEGWEVTAM